MRRLRRIRPFSRPVARSFASVLMFMTPALAWGQGAEEKGAAALPGQAPPRNSHELSVPTEPLRLRPGLLPAIVYPETARRFGSLDIVLTGLGGVAALTSALIGPDENRPQGTISFDEEVRNALRPDSFDAQLAFRDTSDVLLGFSLAYAFIGDTMVNATWLRRSPDVGKQMAFMDAEVAALAFGAAQLTANLVSRERPYGRTCGNELDERSSQCTTNDRYLSHFSSHSTLTFAMAAVTCAHHNALGLSGGKSWIPCLSGFTLAATTAVFRISSDMHYATDVLTGAAVGTLIGFAVPAFHYGFGHLRHGAAPTQVSVLPSFGGIQVIGVW